MQLKLIFTGVSGFRAETIEEMTIEDLYAKEPEEAIEEITNRLPDVIETVFERIYEERDGG
jgi:hypothetical protein